LDFGDPANVRRLIRNEEFRTEIAGSLLRVLALSIFGDSWE
jgi:hypothetical protein